MGSHDTAFTSSILDCLVHDPGAKDTQYGVLNWWIAKPCPDERDERIEVEVLENRKRGDGS